MDLGELKKRLYKQEDGIEGRPSAPEIFEPGREDYVPSQDAPIWAAEDSKKFARANTRRKIFWLAGALLLVMAAGLAVWFFWIGRSSFDTSKVILSVYGQDRIVSGGDVGYIVRLKNNTKVALKNIVLNFTYAPQALPNDETNVSWQGSSASVTQNLPDMAAGQEQQLEFKARVFGDRDSQQLFSAGVSYQPENISSGFSAKTTFASTVISVPLVLSFDLPGRVVSGQTLNFTLKYLNTSDEVFGDSQIQVEYPPGFVFDSAYPSPSSGDDQWSLSAISGQEEGQIIIKGTLNGTEGESKVFRAEIGVPKGNTFVAYTSALSSPQISVSPLWVEQALNPTQDNPTANLSQTLYYQLKYKNTTSATIGPVVITLKIDSQAVDLASVNVPNGFFSSADSTITWNASSLPDLNSLTGDQSGELSFSLRVKDKLSVKSFSDKNFTILTTAQIDSPNVPLSLVGTQLKGTSQLTVKVNSQLTLYVKGYFNDSLMLNSGPLPPRVGQTTTYTIYLQLLNTSNDLSGVIVEAYLPSYIQWSGKIYPTSENLKYDSATGRLIWRIDKLTAGVGFSSPVRQVVFQIGLVPSISQVGNNPDLVKSAKVTALDTYTTSNLASSASDLKTDLPDDPTVGWSNGRVAQ